MSASTIGAINLLPEHEKREIYRRIVPIELLERFKLTPYLTDIQGRSLLKFKYQPGNTSVEMSLYHKHGARDPILYGHLSDTMHGQIHILLYVLNDPASPRFDVDIMPDGQPTKFGTSQRNIEAERDALNFGFADQYEEALPMAALASLDAFDLSQFRNIPDMLHHQQNILRKASANNPINNHTGEETMTVEELKEQYPETYDAVHSAGIEAGRQTERERIKAVENQLMPGHEDLVDKLKYDGETTGEQAAVLILAAEKETRQKMLQNLKDDAVEPVEPAEPADPGANERIMLVQAMAGGINKK